MDKQQIRGFILGGAAGLLLAASIYSKNEYAGDIPPRVSTEIDSCVESKYGSLLVVPAPSPNFRVPDCPRSIEGIVIHSTEGEMPGTLNWLTSRKSGVSSHYLIDQEGIVYQLVDDANVAWHVGKSNTWSIGIELEGFAHKDGFEFTDVQYDKLVFLSALLMDRYGISANRIYTHADITKLFGGTTHTDPGENFDIERFKKQLTIVRNSS
jgi:N-acetyl-anhydromuramyl-L-alanine amidase AmpD